MLWRNLFALCSLVQASLQFQQNHLSFTLDQSSKGCIAILDLAIMMGGCLCENICHQFVEYVHTKVVSRTYPDLCAQRYPYLKFQTSESNSLLEPCECDEISRIYNVIIPPLHNHVHSIKFNDLDLVQFISEFYNHQVLKISLKYN